MSLLNGSLCNFISFIGLDTTVPSIDPRRSTLVDPSQRKFLSLESMERGIASMSAVDKALRNSLVAHAESPEVMSFSLSDKRIAMERMRTS